MNLRRGGLSAFEMRVVLTAFLLTGCAPAVSHFEPFGEDAITYFEDGATCTWKVWSEGDERTLGVLPHPCGSLSIMIADTGPQALAFAPSKSNARHVVPVTTWRTPQPTAYWIIDREAGTFVALDPPREIRGAASARLGFDSDGVLQAIVDLEHVSLLEKVRKMATGTQPKAVKETVQWTRRSPGEWTRTMPDPTVMKRFNGYPLVANASISPTSLIRIPSAIDVDDATAKRLKEVAPGYPLWYRLRNEPDVFYEDGPRRRFAYRDSSDLRVIDEALRTASPIIVRKGDYALSVDSRDGSAPILYDLRTKTVAWKADTATLAVFWRR